MGLNWYKLADAIGDGEAYSYMSPFDRGRMKGETLQEKVKMLTEVVRHEINMGRQIADATLEELNPMSISLAMRGDDPSSEMSSLIYDKVVELAKDDGKFGAHRRGAPLSWGLGYDNGTGWVRVAAALDKLQRMASPGGSFVKMLEPYAGNSPLYRLQGDLIAKYNRARSECSLPIVLSARLRRSTVVDAHFRCLLNEMEQPGSLDACMADALARDHDSKYRVDVEHRSGERTDKLSRADVFMLEAQTGFRHLKYMSYSERNRLARMLRSYAGDSYTPHPKDDPFAKWYIERVRSGNMDLVTTILSGPNQMYRMLESVNELRADQDRKRRRWGRGGPNYLDIQYDYVISSIVTRVWEHVLNVLIDMGEKRYGPRFSGWLNQNERLLRRL